MAGETTVVSPWPQQIFNTDDDKRGYGDTLKARTFGISQQLAEARAAGAVQISDNFAAKAREDVHVDVLKEHAITRKDISALQYAVYSLSEKITAQSGEMKVLLLTQENERLRDRLLRRSRRDRDDDE